MNNNRITDQDNGMEGRTLIGPSTRLTGDIEGKNDFYLEGAMEGTLKLDNLLYIGKNGKFKGDAEALNAILEGKIEGNLVIGKKIEIRSTGHVVGNITCHQVAIADGSYFQGSIKMSDGSHINPTYFTEKRKDLQE